MLCCSGWVYSGGEAGGSGQLLLSTASTAAIAAAAPPLSHRPHLLPLPRPLPAPLTAHAQRRSRPHRRRPSPLVQPQPHAPLAGTPATQEPQQGFDWMPQRILWFTPSFPVFCSRGRERKYIVCVRTYDPIRWNLT